VSNIAAPDAVLLPVSQLDASRPTAPSKPAASAAPKGSSGKKALRTGGGGSMAKVRVTGKRGEVHECTI
jgi:hypothetical protein